VPPGQHGARRGRRPSIYAEQLRAKQRAKRYYGVRERQFRKYVRSAAKNRERVTGEELLRLLERRLDNVVYRLGFASTRAQARQFVNHGHVRVDGRRVDVASYSVRPGQEIAIDASSPVREVASATTELTGTVAPWLQTDFDALSGKVLRLPERAEISAPIDEHLIVELYSRL
jgi:small subunit ribosomal protein S4